MKRQTEITFPGMEKWFFIAVYQVGYWLQKIGKDTHQFKRKLILSYSATALVKRKCLKASKVSVRSTAE